MRSSLTQPNRDETARLLEAAGSTYDPEGVETSDRWRAGRPARSWDRLA